MRWATERGGFSALPNGISSRGRLVESRIIRIETTVSMWRLSLSPMPLSASAAFAASPAIPTGGSAFSGGTSFSMNWPAPTKIGVESSISRPYLKLVA